MNKTSPFLINSKSIVLGLALFSMFFGSGNMIFPLQIGVNYSTSWIVASLGFLISAVLLPLFGVIVLVQKKGSYMSVFNSLFPSYISEVYTAIILVVWIPLVSGPRCITSSHTAIQTALNAFGVSEISIYVFGFFYSALIAFILLQSSDYIRFIGKYLSPILITIIGVMVMFSLKSTDATVIDLDENPLKKSFLNGYNTQDLIAAFFFSSSIYTYLVSEKEAKPRRILLSGGIIAAFVLALVYGGLIYLSAKHSSYLNDNSKGTVFVGLSQLFLGKNLGLLSSLFVAIACVTTSVALLSTFSEYLVKKISASFKQAILITSLLCYLISCTGIDTITAVSNPILQWLYPILVIVSIVSLLR
jgi:branched-chain amino acid:cation transporter, LIVCS family